MRLFHSAAALLVTLMCLSQVEAGLFGFRKDRSECASMECCQPVIGRPCHVNTMCHQRQCCPVMRCETGCTPDCCAPVDCCAPADCCAPTGCRPGALCAPRTCCDDSCTSTTGCCEGCSRCCHDDPCEIAKLIQASKTACYATQRRNAVHHLSDYYDCCCHPQIMNALIYALNDSDHRVRAKAADEIGDQIRVNGCICGPPVISALKYTLADCDRCVRRQAEEALMLCGYRIVDGCCVQQCPTSATQNEQLPALQAPAPPEVPAASDAAQDGTPADDIPVLPPVDTDESNESDGDVEVGAEADAAPATVTIPPPERLPKTTAQSQSAGTELPPASYFPAQLHRRFLSHRNPLGANAE